MVTRVQHYIVFEDGVILELDRVEDAWPCARDNGYTVADYCRRWWLESHEYDEAGEPLGELAVFFDPREAADV
jgi:hypothetical protein